MRRAAKASHVRFEGTIMISRGNGCVVVKLVLCSSWVRPDSYLYLYKNVPEEKKRLFDPSQAR
jgi:hypothetical protein